jgi:NhaP-type Na+/H+ or K+/H+ antiporter
MDWDGELHQDDLHSHFSEGIDSILDVSVFTTLGTVLPWSVWLNPDPPVSITRLVGFSVGILALRRIPAVLALARWMPEIRTFREAIFVGWFGPMGIGAIYYALKACECCPPAWEVVTDQKRNEWNQIMYSSSNFLGSFLGSSFSVPLYMVS